MWDPATWQRHWDEIRSKVRERWSQISDEELAEFHGNVDAMVDWLQARTGETREAFVAWLSEIVPAGEPQLAGEPAAASADGPPIDIVALVPPEWQATVRAAGEWVRRRPVESLAVAFGAGLLAGVLAATILRPRE